MDERLRGDGRVNESTRNVDGVLSRRRRAERSPWKNCRRASSSGARCQRSSRRVVDGVLSARARRGGDGGDDAVEVVAVHALLSTRIDALAEHWGEVEREWALKMKQLEQLMDVKDFEDEVQQVRIEKVLGANLYWSSSSSPKVLLWIEKETTGCLVDGTSSQNGNFSARGCCMIRICARSPFFTTISFFTQFTRKSND